MASTSAFGWETPDDTDLVKDGAAAIRTLGNSIDTSMSELKGGTTGQVLSKTSNTDMDFTWVAQDDSNAIQNAIVDAKGDLIAASAADTPARLAVGNNGETLVADSSTSTGLRWQGDYAAGKNQIINGDFRINQRGFSSQAVTAEQKNYTFDRFYFLNVVGGTTTCSAQTFTAGAAPVAGYESTNFIRLASTGQSSGAAGSFIGQNIEDVRTDAGQTVTVSFWAKAASGTPKVGINVGQNFGTGGSSQVDNAASVTISTSWTRYTRTVTLASISGKTIGSNNYLGLELWTSAGVDFNSRTGSIGIQTTTIDFWGIQLEIGSVATAFQTATGTIQGELAACQRYYFRAISDSGYKTLGNGYAGSANALDVSVILPSQMRVAPTSLETSAMSSFYYESSTGGTTPTSITLATRTTPNLGQVAVNKTGSFTAGYAYSLFSNNTSAYLGFSAEL
jgi:hypothetical protein